MAKQNRSTLRRFFRRGALPTEDQFGDLIDSSLNLIDEGFDKSVRDGFEIHLVGDHDRLISFFEPDAPQSAVWTIKYDRVRNQLLISNPDSESEAPAAMSFSDNGHVGVNKTHPVHALDVGGVIAMEGRIGANPDNIKTVGADGFWHDIAGPLHGCHALEVMAGVGEKGTGRYCLMSALAINTFNPRGWLFNFLNLKKRIKYQRAHYRSRGDRMKLRWRHGEDGNYYLQIRTVWAYSEFVRIRYYLTRLWFDSDMSESWESGEQEL